MMKHAGRRNRADVPITAQLRVLGLCAVGWAITIAILSQALAPGELGVTLATLWVAQVASVICTARAGAAPAETTPSGTAFAASVSLAIFGTALFLLLHANQLPLYAGQPFAVACLFALTVILVTQRCLLQLIGAEGWGPKAPRFSMLPYALAVGLVDRFGDLTTDLALAIAVFVWLCVLLLSASMLAETNRAQPPSHPPELLSGLSRHVDLLLVPLLLAAENALVYLVARGLVQVVTCTLAMIGKSVEPELHRLFVTNRQVEFMASAARLNLGFLLVGGAAALAVITMLPIAVTIFGIGATGAQPVLLWLCLAAVAPSVFGAIEVLFRATETRKNLQIMQFTTVTLLAGSATAFAPDTPLLLAQCVAFAHVITHTFAAVFVAIYAGVWPGWTALFLGRIRLF